MPLVVPENVPDCVAKVPKTTPSFKSFPVIPSNFATAPSVAEDGPTTSPEPPGREALTVTSPVPVSAPVSEIVIFVGALWLFVKGKKD